MTGLDPNDPTVPGVREHVIDSGSPSLRAMLAGACPDEYLPSTIYLLLVIAGRSSYLLLYTQYSSGACVR